MDCSYDIFISKELIKLCHFVEKRMGYLFIVSSFEILKYKMIMWPFYSSSVSFFDFAFNEKIHMGNSMGSLPRLHRVFPNRVKLSGFEVLSNVWKPIRPVFETSLANIEISSATFLKIMKNRIFLMTFFIKLFQPEW